MTHPWEAIHFCYTGSKTYNDKLLIGATALFGQIANHKDVQNAAWLGAIKDALTYPPVQILNSATIGGSISASCPFFDLPVCALALNATVKVRGPAGARDVALEEFCPSLFENTLETGEFMAALEIPVADNQSSSAYEKLETNANDLAILSAGVFVQTDGKGNCSAARVFIGGGVGETPIRSDSAEQALQGSELNDDAIGKAGAGASSDVDPISDHRASAEYRTYMASILVQRALRRALERLN